MLKVLVVAWREFKHTALTKAFIIGTLIFPIVIWGGIFIVQFFVQPSTPPVTGAVALIDPSGEVIDAAEVEFERLREQTVIDRVTEAVAEGDALAAGTAQLRPVYDITIEAHADPDALADLQRRARAGELLAVASIEPTLLEKPDDRNDSLLLYVPHGVNPDHVTEIRRTIGRAVVRARANRHDLDVDEMQALLRAPGVTTRRLTEEGEAAAGVELQQILPIAFMFLLWISAFASGNYLLTTTIEEKSNKVMEVLLSAISPLQLMTGKILGQSLVGLCTVGVYAALGVAALAYFGMAGLIEPIMIVYLGVYYFMAYFMIAAMMAGIGSAVSDLQEAHSLITPAMLIVFIPLLLFVPVSQNPNGTLAVVTSFIPPLTPFVMIIRVTGAEPIAAWQIALSMIVGFAGVMLAIWLCARIFRVGVLMYGKPPSPLELIKWLRYS